MVTQDKNLSSLTSEISRSNTLINQKKFQEAEKCLRNVLSESPSFVPALFNLGTLQTRGGRDEEALRLFTRVLKMEADAIDALNEIGLIHYRAGRFSSAETSFRDALCFDENDARVLNNLGVICFVQERYSEAEYLFDRAAAIDPDSEDYRINLHDTREELHKKNNEKL
ncbi:MAG: tetratricopeptide repeat protein [Spirochaetales bacterium]|jgi:Flp pilus assembly protein TadD|nr:tetratricopeptide repeat protein [Spirochaetales bacterium]